MTHQIRGRHILGGIGLAALFSLPFDVVIVSATITGDRLERAMIASQNRAAKRAADRAIADTVSAAPQPDQSATTSTFGSRSEDGPEESPLAAGGAAVSREDGSSKAGETATSGLGTASRNDHLHSVSVHAGPERRGNQGVTAGETARSARSSSASILGRASMASAQSVRSERSPLGRMTSKQGGGRSLHAMADAASDICGLSEPEEKAMFRRLIQRESEWNPDAVSASGAIGLAQVMPRSALSPTLDVRDPWQNLVAGACLLRQYRDRFGSWRVALHAYHGGPTRVDRRRVAQSSRNYANDVIGGNE